MKNKIGVALLALVIVVTWRVTSREEAPISAGTFLVYDNGGMQIQLTFSPADSDGFDTNISYLDADATYPSARPSSAPSKVVDTRMRTANDGDEALLVEHDRPDGPFRSIEASYRYLSELKVVPALHLILSLCPSLNARRLSRRRRST